MRRPALCITPLTGIPRVAAGDDLAAMLLEAADRCETGLADGDIFVLAQKIVSKSEDRMRDLAQVAPSARARELAQKADKDPRLVELILQESRAVRRCHRGVIIVTDIRGFTLANAGIDASNTGGNPDHVLLLPADPDASARSLRETLHARTGKRIGVVIADSFGRAWRLGTTGTAIGSAGIPALLDMRTRPDMDGRPLRTTEIGVADELAAAASLMMGQADEAIPAVHVRGFPYTGEGRAADLVRPPELDLFP